MVPALKRYIFNILISLFLKSMQLSHIIMTIKPRLITRSRNNYKI